MQIHPVERYAFDVKNLVGVVCIRDGQHNGRIFGIAFPAKASAVKEVLGDGSCVFMYQTV